MDGPPAELYRRDPVAFLLYADLHEKPRSQVTLGDVRRVTGAAEKQAKLAVRELVKLGALIKVGADAYQPANAPRVEVEPAPVLTCRFCHGLLPTGRRVFCSHECSVRFGNKRTGQRARQARGARIAEAPPLSCVVCGTDIPRHSKNHHQLYCSRKCQRVVERQKYLERDIAAGTAGTCKTCGKPMRADLQNWCSPECRPPFGAQRPAPERP